MKVMFHDGLGPQQALGHVHSWEEMRSGKGDLYGHVLLDIPQLVNKKRDTQRCKFFFSTKLWNLYKSQLKVGDAWCFYYRLTGNEVGGKHYLNATVVKANKFWVDEMSNNTAKIESHEDSVAVSKTAPAQSVPQEDRLDNRSAIHEINFDEDLN